MYSFDRFVKNFFMFFDCFISKKYITEDNRFIRDRKMTQKEYTSFILLKEAVQVILKLFDFLQFG